MCNPTKLLLVVSISLFGACTSRHHQQPPKTGERWVTGGKTKPAVTKPAAKRTWETKGSGRNVAPGRSSASLKLAAPAADGRGAFGSGAGGLGKVALGEKPAARAKAATFAAGAKPTSAATPIGAGGVISSGATPSKKRRHVPAPRLDDVLTAGSFDDALDMDFFASYWRKSPLSQRPVPTPRKPPTSKAKALQLALVVDTTGSMGDELEYLKAELKAIVTALDRTHPGVAKEVAIVVYKDDGDEYVTRGLSFTTDLAEAQRFLNEQSAGGGGDYPEAVATAFEEVVSRLQWASGPDTARMLFHVADAPPHDRDLDATFKHTMTLREKNVGIYPIASSGVADMAEAVMRGMALMTGGQYVFLTDDSGVGLPHAAPKHPCYHVEKLKDVMIRLASDRLDGTRGIPQSKNIVRTVGDPQDATCKAKTWTAKSRPAKRGS